MSIDVQVDGEHLDADIESAKLCTQPTCRRVANHCSSLLDALVVFKSWFIQRQGELKSNPAGSSNTSHRITGTNEVAMYDESYSECPGQDRNRADFQVASNVVLERDWAVARVKRAETQLARLRNACMAMRVQLEAGMRYKSEVEQVKRELELTRDTVKHYKNIIDEGNRLREDLRSELARVRKEASMARSQVASSQSRSVVTPHGPGSHSTRVPPPRSKVGSFDRADTLATTVLAMTSPSELDTNNNSPDTGSVFYIRGQLVHYMRCCESLQEEVEQLREAVRDTSEKEVQQAQLVGAVRDKVSNLIDGMCVLEKRRTKRAKQLARSTLNLRWLGELAQLVRVPLPTNFAALMAEEAQNRLQDLETLHTSPRTPSSPQTRTSKRIAQGDRGIGSPSVLSPRAKRRVVHEPNVDIDADWSSDGQTSKTTRTSRTVSEEVSRDFKETTAPCSPNAPSVEYFYSDSESSISNLSDASHHHAPEEKPISPTVENSMSPLRSCAPIADSLKVSGPLSPSRTRNSPVLTIPGTPPALDESPSSFKTPLARPSRVKRLSDCEPTSVASPSKQSNSDSPSRTPERKRSTQRSDSTSSQDSTEPPVSVDLVHPQSTCMLARSRSNSSHDSSPIVDVATNEISTGDSITKPPVKKESTTLGRTLCETVSEIHEDLTSRIHTCPKSHSRRSRARGRKSMSADPSTALLALLETHYPPNLIQWFDRISVNTERADKKQSSIDQTIDSNATVSPSTEKGNIALSYSDSTHTHAPNMSRASFEAMYADYLIGGSSQPSAELTYALLSSSNEPSVLYGLWDGLARTMHSSQTTELQTQLETKFINLSRSVFKEHNRVAFVEKLSNHLLNNLSDFLCYQMELPRLVYVTFTLLAENTESSINFARLFFIHLVRSLFVAHDKANPRPLDYLPLILDASIQGFAAMWNSVEPLRDAAAVQFYSPVTDPSTYSYWIATVQALVAWQEARYDQDNRHRVSQNQEALFVRLHKHGWLPESRPKRPQNTKGAVRSAVLSQHTHRLRCLALRLVDACLNVKRERNFDTPLVMDVIPPGTNQVSEAACSLMVLISAMAFVVGEEAVTDHHDNDTPEMPDSNSAFRCVTHQRRRRQRQIQRQQRFGLLGWLLTGRLLPWFGKCFKTLKNDDNTPPANLIVDRLALLITDLIVLGGYLFHHVARPTRGSDTEELRTVVFDSGRRMVRMLHEDPMACRYMSANTRRICLTRLFPFEPTQVLQALVDTNMHVVGWTCTDSMLHPISSFLWPEVPPNRLAEQVLTLIDRVVPNLPNALVQRYRDMCNS